MEVSLAFNMRPLSIAYFIDEEDLDRFSQVSLLACTQWGGMHSTIVPVGPAGVGGWFSHALYAHPPDLVVPACVEHAERLKPFLAEHLQYVRTWDWEHFVQHDQCLHATSFYPPQMEPLAPLNSAINRPSLLVYEPEQNRDSFGRACITAAFGGIYPGQQDDYESRFGLVPLNLVMPNMPFLEHQLQRDPLSSPINLTTAYVEPHHVAAPGDQVHFDVVLASTVWDLCWYWTKRGVEDATAPPGTRRVLLIPATDFAAPAVQRRLFDVVRRELAAASPGRTSNLDINFVTDRPGNMRPRSTIRKCSKSAVIRPLGEGERIEQVSRSGRVEGEWPAPRHKGEEPLTFTINLWLDLPGPYLEGFDYTPAKPVDLHEGRNTLYVPPHPPLSEAHGQICLDLESDLWDRYPRSQALAGRIWPESRFTYGKLTVWASPNRYDRRLELMLPSDLEAIRLYFHERGYEARLGVPGRRAQAVINLMGGIQSCTQLLDPAVFRLLEALTVPSTTKLAQDVTALLQCRLERLGELDIDALASEVRAALADAEAIPSRSATPSTLQELRAHPSLRPHADRILTTLDDLVSKRMVFRGVSVKCSECDTLSWFPLRALDDFVTCPACFAEQLVSVGAFGGERPWEYRLNAAVNAALDQDAIAAVLMLAKLSAEPSGAHCPLAGVELLPAGSGNSVGDFDFLYVRAGRLYAGECKAGRRLQDKDIKLARLAHDLGCDAFHFSSLRGFDEQSSTRIKWLTEELGGVDFPIVVEGPEDIFWQRD